LDAMTNHEEIKTGESILIYDVIDDKLLVEVYSEEV